MANALAATAAVAAAIITFLIISSSSLTSNVDGIRCRRESRARRFQEARQGRDIVATARRLVAAGIHLPDRVRPTDVSAGQRAERPADSAGSVLPPLDPCEPVEVRWTF